MTMPLCYSQSIRLLLSISAHTRPDHCTPTVDVNLCLLDLRFPSLRGGRVIDVAQGIDGVRDVILSGQTIEDVVIPGGQFDPTDIVKDVSG